MEVRRDWLHGGELDARWEACASPERPPDREIYFEIGCAGCRIALEAAVRTEPAPGELRRDRPPADGRGRARGRRGRGSRPRRSAPAAYSAELARAIPGLVEPLAGSRGIGEQRGRLARLTRSDLTEGKPS